MKPFLKEVAEDIFKRYQNRLSDYVLVFPNKRTRLFFRKFYGETTQKTTWSPNAYTITEFIQKLSKLTICDSLTLNFDLHKSFNNVFKNKEVKYIKNTLKTFDRFYHLGEIILKDLEEIDQNIVDIKQLFSNIKNAAEIDAVFELLNEEQRQVLRNFWQYFSEENRSIQKQMFIEIWSNLPEIYQHFTQKLKQKNIAYEGLLYRNICEQLKAGKQFFSGRKKIIFVGFNDLSKAQIEIFNHLKQRNIAEFYWDVDNYYIENQLQEAGLFLRKNIKKYPSQIPLKNLFTEKKNIEIISVALEAGQAKALQILLSEKQFHLEDLEQTVIVLPDEHLLFPVLHSIPPEYHKINVTMGYPLQNTALFSLLKQYIELQAYARKLNDNQKITYYHKDVISLLKHPDIWYNDTEKASELLKEFEDSNRVYIDATILTEHENILYRLVFTPVFDDGNLFLENILSILFGLFTTGQQEKGENHLENEYIYQTFVKIKRLKEILDRQKEQILLPVAIKLLTQLLQSTKIPFTGEPLEGLQVMGLLETRSLDFKNVIIISMNEGFFPSNTEQNSFLTQNIRQIFGLNTQKHHDSIYAYYFYRLLQRAENICLLYNSVTGYQSTGELSRFAQQLLLESPHKIKMLQQRQELKLTSNRPIEIKKDKNIQTKLNEYLVKNKYAKRRFSASAINTYIDCPLKFYFRYIARLEEYTKIEEEISPMVFGNILHFVLEFLYKQHIETQKTRIVEKNDIKTLKKNVKDAIKAGFNDHFKYQNEDFEFEGNQLIIKEVLAKYINNILNHDQTIAPFELVSLEEKDNAIAFVNITVNNTKQQIAVFGIIDRVDKKDNLIRIIDYKTGGSIKTNFNNFEDVFSRDKKQRKKEILQTFLYGLIYKQNHKNYFSSVYPVLYAVRDMYKKDYNGCLTIGQRNAKTEIKNRQFNKLIEEYEKHLSEILSELFDNEIPFFQTENEDFCQYCCYNLLCK